MSLRTPLTRFFITGIALLTFFLSSFALPRALSAPNNSLEVWWPTSGATVTGEQPFQVMLQGVPVDEYEAYWRVDNGQLNAMPSNFNGYPHKEVSVDVSNWKWRATGAYEVTFVVKRGTTTVATTSVSLYTGPATIPQAVISTSTTASIITKPPVTKPQTALYMNPESDAAASARAWQYSRPEDARRMAQLVAQPTALWLGNWNKNVEQDVQTVIKKASSSIPVFVAYNIPLRDYSGGYSSGGIDTAAAYTNWITMIARGIGSASAIVILEPDALADIGNLPVNEQQKRYTLLAAAVKKLKENSNTRVYLDAGHAGWIDGSEMAERLKKAGVSQADGFSLNVSNYQPNDQIIRYGTALSEKLAGKHFVIDTSRNGNGAGDGQWCNLPTASIGRSPTLDTGITLVDAFLWVKVPGQSDGTCNGGPSAGVWWPEMALSLVTQAR